MQQFVGAMIDMLSQEYMIDLGRVYACGYSNRRFLTYDLACRVSDRIAAIGAISSFPFRTLHTSFSSQTTD